jgi:hypothetical protein
MFFSGVLRVKVDFDLWIFDISLFLKGMSYEIIMLLRSGLVKDFGLKYKSPKQINSILNFESE